MRILFSHTSKLYLLTVLLMLVYGISGQEDSTSTHTIDERITEASKAKGASSMIGDTSGRMIRTELDMMLTQEQYRVLYGKQSWHRSRTNRGAVLFAARWTNNQIPYIISSSFSSKEKAKIEKAMSDWQLNTCITFTEATSYDRNFVFIQDGSRCRSYMGMIGGRQTLDLNKQGCLYHGIIIHEIGHAIGLVHEQSRPDRDDHVTILEHNIDPSTDIHTNFQKYDPTAVSSYGIPYDYLSIMHYGEALFAKPGLISIQTKDPTYQKRIGNQNRLSFRDIKLANLMYKCGETCNPSIVCPGEGFVGKDCKCWCPGSPIKQCDGTVMTTSRPVVGPTLESCVDMDPNCPDWFQNGFCENNVYVRDVCKNSCSLCGSTCADVDEDCQYWKNQGYCYGTHAASMRQSCPVACGWCPYVSKRNN